MNDPAGQRGAGISLLALMTLLVALLAMMLSFSLWLRGVISGHRSADQWLLLGLAVLGLAYVLQAWALWTLRRWTRTYTVALLVIMTVAGLAEVARNDAQALSTILVFMLAFITSLAGLLALHPAATRAVFTR
jgi:hypothetical protein